MNDMMETHMENYEEGRDTEHQVGSKDSIVWLEKELKR